jgi:hypothetical protein
MCVPRAHNACAPACALQVNSGILFIRPSRALHAHILAEKIANPRIRCMMAVQDLLNGVMWGSFGDAGFECMPQSVHCLPMFYEDCGSRVAKFVQFAGVGKPWVSREPYENSRYVTRCAEFNARYADWEAGAGGSTPVACWPGETWVAEVIDIDRGPPSHRSAAGSRGIAVAPVHKLPLGAAPGRAAGAAPGVIPFYGMAPSNASVVRALAPAARALSGHDAARLVFSGAASVWVDAVAGTLVLRAGRRIVAFDAASHIIALTVAAAMGEPAPTLVAAAPSALLAWAASERDSGGVDEIVIVASVARLEPFCTPRMLAAWPRRLPLPVVWLPQDCDMSGVGALAAALSPCATELWAHPYVAARCGSHVVRPVPLMAVPELAVHVSVGSGVPRDIDIVLLTANAISKVACTELSEHTGDARSIACYDVGSVMTGRSPTVGDLTAMVARARAVVVSYDAVRSPAGADVSGLAPPPPPVVVSLACGGRRVVAWCVETLTRADALCDLDAPPGAVLVVRSAEAAVAEAARIGGGGLSSNDAAVGTARAVAEFWARMHA